MGLRLATADGAKEGRRMAQKAQTAPPAACWSWALVACRELQPGDFDGAGRVQALNFVVTERVCE